MNAPSMVWRWITLLVIIGNVSYNWLYDIVLPPGADMAEVSARYPTLFTPAGYAFSIWGVIYLAFLIYGVYQVLPAQRGNGLFDRLALPTIAAHVLASIWITLFRYEQLNLCVFVIFANLGAALAGYIITRRGAVSVPYSMLLGWLSVASIANVAIALRASGWQPVLLDAQGWTIAMVSVAGLLGVLFAFMDRNGVYPAVISWATFAIYVARDSGAVATTALTISIVCALCTLWTVLRVPHTPQVGTSIHR